MLICENNNPMDPVLGMHFLQFGGNLYLLSRYLDPWRLVKLEKNPQFFGVNINKNILEPPPEQ